MAISFKNYLQESSIDQEQQNYSIDIFDNTLTNSPTLKKSIKLQILDLLISYEKIAPIKHVCIIGGILTKQYNDFSDIDVNVLFDASEDQRNKLLDYNEGRGGVLAGNSQHPINFYIITDEERFNRANEMSDNVYDLFSDKFLKQTVIKSIDIHNYMKEYSAVINRFNILTDTLKNDLIELDHLKTVPISDIKRLHALVKNQYEKILVDLKNIVTYGNSLIKQRREIFTKELTPEQIRRYGNYNNLPQNVIYKLLERHYYLDLIHKLEKILDNYPPLPYKELIKLLD